MARLRRQEGIQAQRRCRFRITVANQNTPAPAPNLLQRQFLAPAPNRIWVGDMTFIRTRTGFLYLAVLLDLFARNVVGWAMHERPNREVAMRALEMALARRLPQPGLVHHTDQGPLYSAYDYRERLRASGLVSSMSRRGDCLDNAVAESFFKTMKTEMVYHHQFATRQEASLAVFEYIEGFYNRKRRHSALRYLTPCQYEEWLYQQNMAA